MGFLVGFILGAVASYLIVSYFAELKLRVEILEDSLGFDKEQAYKWLMNKNPGIGLQKPAELKFNQFYKFVKEIENSAA